MSLHGENVHVTVVLIKVVVPVWDKVSGLLGSLHGIATALLRSPFNHLSSAFFVEWGYFLPRSCAMRGNTLRSSGGRKEKMFVCLCRVRGMFVCVGRRALCVGRVSACGVAVQEWWLYLRPALHTRAHQFNARCDISIGLNKRALPWCGCS